jgi:hypothetical protein
VVVTVGDAIAVSPARSHDGGEDPLLAEIETSLTGMLEIHA